MSRRTDLADVPAVLYGVEEAAAALRLSRSVLYELIRSGQLRTVKQGRRRLVPVSALAKYVAGLESGVAPGHQAVHRVGGDALGAVDGGGVAESG